MRNRTSWPLAAWLVLAGVLASAGAFGQSGGASARNTHTGKAVLEGKLALRGEAPVVVVHGKEIRLAANSTYLMHTLADPRLENCEVRLEGTTKPDGVFEAAHLYTVHDGKLFRVRYYCDVCNIAALEPGRCVCCQRPTELQELPVSETDKDTVAN